MKKRIEQRIGHFQPGQHPSHIIEKGNPVGEMFGKLPTRGLLKTAQRQLEEASSGQEVKPRYIRQEIQSTWGAIRFKRNLRRAIHLHTTESGLTRLFKDEMKNANSTLMHILKLLAPTEAEFAGFRNFTQLAPNDPKELLLKLTAPVIPDADVHNYTLDAFRRGRFISQQQHFELDRLYHLTLGGMQIAAERSINSDLRHEAIQIQNMLEKHLFQGPYGYTVPVETYSVHDNRTNKVVALSSTCPPSVEDDQHVKYFKRDTRYISGVGYVMTNTRLKSRESELIKAYKRAMQRAAEGKGDSVKVKEDIKDSLGIIFVVKDAMDSLTDPRVNVLQHKVFATLKQHYNGRITFKEDPQNGTSDQSSQLRYRKWDAHVQGLPVPIELIFYAEGDYINNDYHVGTYDEEKKRYSGEARPLYERYRALSALDALFPPSIPRYSGLRNAAYQTIDQVAAGLFEERKVEVPTLAQKDTTTEPLVALVQA